MEVERGWGLGPHRRLWKSAGFETRPEEIFSTFKTFPMNGQRGEDRNPERNSELATRFKKSLSVPL